MNGATDCCIFQSTALFEFAMYYTKKTTINKQILCRFQKNFCQRSENWNSPSLFRCFAPCLAFLRAEKLSCSVVLPPKNAETFIGPHFFLHTPDFSLSKVTALNVVWGKDTSRRSKEPGSDLPSYFSTWAPFCKCGWRHHNIQIWLWPGLQEIISVQTTRPEIFSWAGGTFRGHRRPRGRPQADRHIFGWGTKGNKGEYHVTKMANRMEMNKNREMGIKKSKRKQCSSANVKKCPQFSSYDAGIACFIYQSV